MNNNKFRVWDDDNKAFDYLDFSNLDSLIEKLDEIRDYFWNAYLTENNDAGNPLLTRYSGLNDKNDKEVYDGDIVIIDGCRDEPHKISYLPLNYKWEVEPLDCNRVADCLEEFIEDNLEVIGNIYENPELFKPRV